MKRAICISLLFLVTAISSHAQQPPRGGGEGRSFSLSSLEKPRDIPDSLILNDTTTTDRIKAYRLTPLGEAYRAPMDTNRMNFGNSSLVEGQSLAVGYLGNIGSPAQTRMFSERKESRDFIFADAYDYYITTPANADFYDTKIPYTNVLYNFAGGDQKKEERLKGVLTLNFGKQLNVGADLDYIYSRGFYNSNGNKIVSYRLFGTFNSDRYEAKAYLSNYNIVNYENGGLTNDEYITNPDEYNGKQKLDSKNYNVRFNEVFNRVRGKQYYLTHRYNLGFYREIANPEHEEHAEEETAEEGHEEPTEIFIPVSSISHTLFYEDNRRHFTTGRYSLNALDTCYQYVNSSNSELHDRPSSWSLQNTVALSLREGFQDWVKFGLSAFIRMDNRKFKMASPRSGQLIGGIGTVNQKQNLDLKADEIFSEFSTYLGGELSKRQGSILTYNARGELCVVGDDLGEFRLSGELETRFSLFRKEARIKAEGYINNVSPAFFHRRYHSRYFSWENKFKNTKHMYAGGTIELESTRTRISAGVNSIQNYIYFNRTGFPEQHDGNIQVVSARIRQDFRAGPLGWENEAAYQLSSEEGIIPLPQWSLYTNLYFDFKLAKVLSVQIGADAHYFSSYYAPYYEPATQQFQLQSETYMQGPVKIGSYPLINAYANFHLKQARFFVSAYNIGTLLMDTDYFSLPHYPLNPMFLKFGISVFFNN